MTESPAPQPLPQLDPHEFRADGWPLCPVCGEDEVYSLIWNDGPRPSMDEFMAGALACYRCTWKKPAQPQPLPARCQIQDCPNAIATWMVSEMAPGRPLVYGVCERDAAMIHMAEMPK